MKPTEGFNYEVKKIGNTNVGIFDVSGDPTQYDVINIITKSVNISGIIFMVRINNQLDKLKEAQQALHLLFSNKYLNKGLKLFVIYNRSNDEKESYDWMTQQLFDNQMKLEVLKNTFDVEYNSAFHDCFQVESLLSPSEQLETKLLRFSNFLTNLIYSS